MLARVPRLRYRRFTRHLLWQAVYQPSKRILRLIKQTKWQVGYLASKIYKTSFSI